MCKIKKDLRLHIMQNDPVLSQIISIFKDGLILKNVIIHKDEAVVEIQSVQSVLNGASKAEELIKNQGIIIEKLRDEINVNRALLKKIGEKVIIEAPRAIYVREVLSFGVEKLKLRIQIEFWEKSYSDEIVKNIDIWCTNNSVSLDDWFSTQKNLNEKVKNLAEREVEYTGAQLFLEAVANLKSF
jgi:hypothetical protein